MTLGVSPPYRRLGVASELVRRSLAVLAECVPECTNVTLHVHVTNLAALTFYERHGFERVEKLVGYYARLVPPDAWVLSRRCEASDARDASDEEGEKDDGSGLIDEIEAAFGGRGYGAGGDEVEGEEEVCADGIDARGNVAWHERHNAGRAPGECETDEGARRDDSFANGTLGFTDGIDLGSGSLAARPASLALGSTTHPSDSSLASPPIPPSSSAPSSSAPRTSVSSSTSPALSSPSARSSPVHSPFRRSSRVSSHLSSSPPTLVPSRPQAQRSLMGVACLPALDGGVAGILDVETLVADLPPPPTGLER